jgi:hypothetical protein
LFSRRHQTFRFWWNACRKRTLSGYPKKPAELEAIMTSRTRKNHSTESSGETAATWNLLDGSFGKLMEHNRTMMEHTLKALQEESLRFMNTRLEHTAKTLEDCRECSGLTGLMAVQNDWFAGIAHDYLEQSRRFAEVWREIAEHNSSVLAEGAAVTTQLRVHRNEHERQAA